MLLLGIAWDEDIAERPMLLLGIAWDEDIAERPMLLLGIEWTDDIPEWPGSEPLLLNWGAGAERSILDAGLRLGWLSSSSSLAAVRLIVQAVAGTGRDGG